MILINILLTLWIDMNCGSMHHIQVQVKANECENDTFTILQTQKIKQVAYKTMHGAIASYFVHTLEHTCQRFKEENGALPHYLL